MALKELMAWRLVQLKHIKGDRREYFEAPGDAWEIFKKLAEERRKREIEPTLSMLRSALLVKVELESDVYAQARMQDMYQLMETANTWFDEIQSLSPQSLMQLMKMGSQVRKLLTVKDSIVGAVSKHSPSVSTNQN
jgi:DNA-binding transcriptional regulator GbsR (MarR family)